jgi:hypothetical protein
MIGTHKVVVCVMGKAFGFFLKQQYQYAGENPQRFEKPETRRCNALSNTMLISSHVR